MDELKDISVEAEITSDKFPKIKVDLRTPLESTFFWLAGLSVIAMIIAWIISPGDKFDQQWQAIMAVGGIGLILSVALYFNTDNYYIFDLVNKILFIPAKRGYIFPMILFASLAVGLFILTLTQFQTSNRMKYRPLNDYQAAFNIGYSALVEVLADIQSRQWSNRSFKNAPQNRNAALFGGTYNLQVEDHASGEYVFNVKVRVNEIADALKPAETIKEALQVVGIEAGDVKKGDDSRPVADDISLSVAGLPLKPVARLVADIAPKSSYVIKDLRFGGDVAELDADQKLLLDNLAELLNERPDCKIELRGHATGVVGTPESNMTFSILRAQNAADYLQSVGVAADRMTVKGFGMTQPIASNETLEGQAKNRRVEFVLEEEL